MDFKHHPTDVIGGAFIGCLIAFIIVSTRTDTLKPQTLHRNVSVDTLPLRVETLLTCEFIFWFIDGRSPSRICLRLKAELVFRLKQLTAMRL